MNIRFFNFHREEHMTIHDHIIHWCLWAALFLVPMFFLPMTTEPLEMNKMFLFSVLVLIAGVTWFVQHLRNHQLGVPRTPFDIPLALFLIFSVLATAFSLYHYRSIVGVSGYFSDTLVANVFFVLFFFLLAATVRREHLWRLFTALLAGGAVIAFLNFLQVFDVHLFPWDFAQQVSFNAVANSRTLFGVYLTLLGLGTFMAYGRSTLMMHRILLIALGVVTLFLMLVYDVHAGWIIGIAGMLLIMLFSAMGERSMQLNRVLGPSLFIGFAIIALLVDTQSLLGASIPQDVRLPVAQGASVTLHAIAQRPFTGTGQETFDAAFTKFRPLSVNDTSVWNLRFIKASNEWFQKLTTIGVFGVLALLWVIVIACKRTIEALMKTKHHDTEWGAQLLVLLGLAGMIITSFLAPFTFVFSMLLWFFLGAAVVVWQKKPTEIRPTKEKQPHSSFGASFGFSLSLILGVVFLFFAVKVYAADVAQASGNALLAKQGDITEIQKTFTHALSLNGYEQTAYFDLAQNLLAQARLGAQQEKPDVDNISNMLAAAVASGRTGAEKYPAYAGSYEALGSLYITADSMTGTSSDATLEALTKAHELEPNNPELAFNLGQYYLTKGQQQGKTQDDATQEQKDAAAAQAKQTFTQAKTWFTNASGLKKNYIPAVLNIALVNRLLGDAASSVKVLEELATNNPLDTDVLFNLSENYLIDGHDAEALATLKRIVSIFPGHSDAHYRLAGLYEKQGDYAKATEELTTVKSLNPGVQGVQEKITELKAKL